VDYIIKDLGFKNGLWSMNVVVHPYLNKFKDDD
jgi:hypothetical protein